CPRRCVLRIARPHLLPRLPYATLFRSAFDVLDGDVDLEVDPVARALAPERRDLGGVGDDRGGEAVVEHVDDGEADAVHRDRALRSEEHTSELQSRENLVCRLLLEKKTL